MEKSRHASKTVLAVCLLAFFAVMGAVSVYAYLQNKKEEKEIVTTAETDVAPITSFSALYPFSDGTGQAAAEESMAEESMVEESILSCLQNTVERLTNAVDVYTSSMNPLAVTLKDMTLRFDILMNNTVVLNGYSSFVRLENGYMAYILPYSDPQASCDSILSFSEWLKERNIRFLTLIPANKSDDSITEFPEGVPHGYTRTKDEYTDFLRKNGLAYLDAKQYLLAENNNFYGWFYKTDHHWNVYAGRLTAEKTAVYLREKWGIPTDAEATAENNFTLTVYPNSFLGSMGYKFGNSYKEDFEVLYPTVETSFRIQVPSKGIDRIGSFSETLIAEQYLSNSAYYSAFLYGDMPLICIENLNCRNGTRLLIIKKSNANIVCPYLALTVQYVDIIDPRHFDGSIRSFIEQTSPDAVITCASLTEDGDNTFWCLK